MSLNPTKKQKNQKEVYCLHPSGDVNKVLEGFYTINGLAFSPDYKTAYVSDSAPWIRTIWSYDYDLEDGVWSNKKVFLKLTRLMVDLTVDVLMLRVVIGWQEFLVGN